MQVLVAGGTGFIGRHLCAALADRGHAVTACSRDPDPSAAPDGVQVEAGDVTTFDSIAPLIEATDAVVNLVALSPLFKPSGGEEVHERVHLTGTRNVVRAMADSPCDRLLQFSAIAADPEGPTSYLRAKGKAERVITAADVDWTIVRPTVVFGPGDEFVPMTRTLTTPYVTGLPGGGRSRFQPIAVTDLVNLMARALEDESHVEEVYELGGPTVYTLADVTRAIYAAENKPVRIIPIPMALARIGLAVIDPVPGIPFGRDQYRALSVDAIADPNDVDAFDVAEADLTTLEEDLADR